MRQIKAWKNRKMTELTKICIEPQINSKVLFFLIGKSIEKFTFQKCQDCPWHMKLWFQTELCCCGHKCEVASVQSLPGEICSLTRGMWREQESQFVWHTHTQVLIITKKGSDFHWRVGFPAWQAWALQFVSTENIWKVKFHSLMLERKGFIG